MQIKLYKAFLLLIMSGLLFSCGEEDNDDSGMSEFKNSNLTVEISSADLIGRWEIISMEGDEGVDFNGDSISNKDMLSETACFDSMYFDFDENEVVQTGQAKLWFDSDGNFTCFYGVYDATYSISGDILTVNFNLNGSPMTEDKQISITSDSSGDYLHVNLTAEEAAAYVNDPGTTNASHVGNIKMVYKKK